MTLTFLALHSLNQLPFFFFTTRGLTKKNEFDNKDQHLVLSMQST